MNLQMEIMSISHCEKAEMVYVIDHMTLGAITQSNFVLCGTLRGRGQHFRLKRFLNN